MTHLPLTALRAFEAAARHLSLTRAAQELCVTHGAISRQIRQLEDALGVALFVRTGRGLLLTPAGQALQAPTHSAFALLAAGCRQVAAMARRGPLAVASPGTFLMRWLIPRLDQFRRQYPEQEVRLSAANTPAEALLGGADVLIGVAAPPWPAGCQVHLLAAETFGPVLSPALLAARTLPEPQALHALPRLHTATRPQVWAEWAQAVGLAHTDLSGGPSFDHLYYMLEAAVAGIGVAIAPALLVAGDLAAGRLVAPFGFVSSGLHYYIAIPAERAADPAVLAFRDWLLTETQAGSG